MTLKEIADWVEAIYLTGETEENRPFQAAFGSDLMSDVLAFVEEETLLLTGLCNNQVIRTAEMLDLKAVLFVRGKQPTDEVIALAREKNIALLTTHHTLYVASGILYGRGLPGLDL